jgi:hypothetical protein
MDSEKQGLLDTLQAVISCACAGREVDGSECIDSMAISTYADAIMLLAQYGRVEITAALGRRVIGKLVIK